MQLTARSSKSLQLRSVREITIPGPKKNVKQWRCGLCLQVPLYEFTYFWAPGMAPTQEFSKIRGAKIDPK